MLVGSIFSVKPIPGVLRPCITSVVPKENGSGVLLDVGALMPTAKPDVLQQFGLLGAMLARHVPHRGPRRGPAQHRPRGEEREPHTQAAYQLMKEAEGYRFIGNVEGATCSTTRPT